MNSFLKTVLVFFAVVFLSFTSVYGSLTFDATPVLSAGSMQLSSFKNGVGIFQENRGRYYTLSPFNDYYITNQGSRSSFISQEEIDANSFTSDYKQSHIKDIIKSIGGYFNVIHPSITFKNQYSVSYTTSVQKNTIFITRAVTFPFQDTSAKTLGSTITYNAEDFVFDSTGHLYTYQTDKDKADFEKVFHVPLNERFDALLVPVNDKRIFIVNPNIAGVIVVSADKQQHLSVNRNNRLIQIEELIEPHNNAYKNTVRIEVFKNPQEALQAK